MLVLSSSQSFGCNIEDFKLDKDTTVCYFLAPLLIWPKRGNQGPPPKSTTFDCHADHSLWVKSTRATRLRKCYTILANFNQFLGSADRFGLANLKIHHLVLGRFIKKVNDEGTYTHKGACYYYYQIAIDAVEHHGNLPHSGAWSYYRSLGKATTTDVLPTYAKGI